MLGFIGLVSLSCAWLWSRFERNPESVLKSVVEVLADTFVWNMLISQLFGSIFNLSFNIVVDYQSTNLSDPDKMALASFIISIILSVGIVLVFVYLLGKKALEIWKLFQANPNLTEEDRRICKYLPLFKDLKTELKVTLFYNLIFYTRLILFNLVVSLLPFTITLQMSLLLIFNVGMLLYVSIYKPFKLLAKNMEVIFYELCLAIINTLVLAINESLSSTPTTLGTIVITLNFVLLAATIFFTCVEFYYVISRIVTKYRLEKKKKKVTSEIHFPRLFKHGTFSLINHYTNKLENRNRVKLSEKETLAAIPLDHIKEIQLSNDSNNIGSLIKMTSGPKIEEEHLLQDKSPAETPTPSPEKSVFFIRRKRGAGINAQLQSQSQLFDEENN